MPPSVASLDHLVLTVADVAASVDFYETVLGMRGERFQPAEGPPRWALKFGAQKINLHEAGAEFRPHAAHPGPGTADLCFLTETPVATWQAHLAERGVAIEVGPVRRTGATGPILSLYFRDPDGTLIEVSHAL
jgi:catechol 2,3-dioxygenase-like lactoylglutathione lyase family enzyme